MNPDALLGDVYKLELMELLCQFLVKFSVLNAAFPLSCLGLDHALESKTFQPSYSNHRQPNILREKYISSMICLGAKGSLGKFYTFKS